MDAAQRPRPVTDPAINARALAWRTLSAKPGRAALAVTGVMVTGALLLNMLLLSRGLLLSFRDLLDTLGYDVRVVAAGGAPELRVPVQHPSALVAELQALPEVAEVGFLRRNPAAVTVGGRPVRITLVEASAGAERHVWRIVKGGNLGDAPRSAEAPLVVNRPLADALGLAPGASLPVRMALSNASSAMPSQIYRVVGVAEFDFEPDGQLAAATTLGAPVHVAGAADEAELVLVSSRASYGPRAAAAAINRRRPDLRAFSNEQLVQRFSENSFAYFRQISLVLSTITIGFAFLLVATLLSVSVNQRLHEVAALRALGLPRRRIAATLVWESAWLVGAGGVLSVPLGGALAVMFDRILRGMPGLPERLHFFVFEPRAFAVHLAVLAVTAAGASVYPVWVATRLPIAATLRQETL